MPLATDHEPCEGDEVLCELCGNAYSPAEIDRGHCPVCAEFADLDEWMY